jgi:hypothetical protein
MYFSGGESKSGGVFSWWLYGGNHEQVAWAGETFPSLSNAKRAAESFKAGAATARFEVYEDAGGSTDGVRGGPATRWPHRVSTSPASPTQTGRRPTSAITEAGRRGP